MAAVGGLLFLGGGVGGLLVGFALRLNWEAVLYFLGGWVGVLEEASSLLAMASAVLYFLGVGCVGGGVVVGRRSLIFWGLVASVAVVLVGDGVGGPLFFGGWVEARRMVRRRVFVCSDGGGRFRLYRWRAMVLYFLNGASAAIGMCGDWHRSAVINCPFWLSGYCHKSGANRPIVVGGVSAIRQKMRRRDGVGIFASEGYSSAFCVGGLLVGVLFVFYYRRFLSTG